MTDRERIAQVVKNTQALIDEYRKNDKATFYQKGKADGMELVVTALKNIFEK